MQSEGSEKSSSSSGSAVNFSERYNSGPGLTTFGDITGNRPEMPPISQQQQVLPPTLPGARDDTLRENILQLFGSALKQAPMSYFSQQNVLEGMYKTYVSTYGPVDKKEFVANISDYFVHKGGRRRSVIKRRKSISKKRKNRRKTNKKQRRR